MCHLLAFILFFLFAAVFSSATQSEDEHDFDPLSFLVDPYEHEKSTSSHLSNVQPTNTVAQVPLSASSPSTNHTPQPQRTKLKIKGESSADYQKRKYEHQQTLFHSKPNDEKERLTKKKIDHQRNYRMRTKERIGFQSPKQARIAGLKVLQKAGLATEQHQQELKHAILQRQKAQQKFEAKKRSQGFRRTAKGWLRFFLCVELGTSLDNADKQPEQITPIGSAIKRKKPIDLNKFPSTSDSSDEEEKRLKKKAKGDRMEPSSKLTIKQIKELKAKERYQKVRAKRMNLPAEELKKFRLRQNTYNRKYRQDLQNKINSATTDNPSNTQTKQFDLVGYRKRKNNNQKKYIEKMKKITGFSDMRQAKLHEASRARQAGTLTQQQEQLLKNEHERKQRYYDKKKSAKIATKSTVDQQ